MYRRPHIDQKCKQDAGNLRSWVESRTCLILYAFLQWHTYLRSSKDTWTLIIICRSVSYVKGLDPGRIWFLIKKIYLYYTHVSCMFIIPQFTLVIIPWWMLFCSFRKDHHCYCIFCLCSHVCFIYLVCTWNPNGLLLLSINASLFPEYCRLCALIK